MSLIHHGAQRASRRSSPLALVMAVAAVFAIGGIAVAPQSAEAAGKKVVIVVGPSGSSTSNYIYNAKLLAAQARSYGATVVEIYSPNATWAKVKPAAQGANVFIYLGHGNGWPSPYGSWQTYTKDGLGLNSTAGNGHHNTKYWGEYYIARDIRFAPNAVVILNRLCYASGNSEPGHAYPTKSVAVRRVDNYGAGFLRAGAKAVFAEGISSASFVLSGLFKTNRSILSIFYSSGSATKSYAFSFRSSRTSGMVGVLDPKSGSRYYRSVIGVLGMTAVTFRG